MPLVSIIVPIYNVEKYLKRCIDSVLEQTFKDFELILVNDGSTDNSGDICKEYEAKDKRIKYFYQNNNGVSAARSKGLKASNGKYVMYIDSDDFIYKDMVKRMVEIITEEKADIVECEYSLINDINSEIDYKVIDREIKSGDKNFALDRMVSIPFSNVVWNKIYRKNIIKDIDFIKARICEDVDYSYKAILNCKKYIYTNEKLYGYVYRKDSLCRINKYEIELLDGIYIQEKRLKALKSNNINSDIIKKAEYRLFNDVIRHYCLVYKNINKKSEHLIVLKDIINSNKNDFFSNNYLKSKRIKIYTFLICPNIIIFTEKIKEKFNGIWQILKYKIISITGRKRYV